MAEIVQTISRHDTAEYFWMQFLDETGQPLNLTGCTLVCTLVAPNGTYKLNRAAASIANQTTDLGWGYYAPNAADVNTSGRYRLEGEVTYPSGRKETRPRKATWIVHIVDDLDNV